MISRDFKIIPKEINIEKALINGLKAKTKETLKDLKQLNKELRS